jgi:hypothetical protein
MSLTLCKWSLVMLLSLGVALLLEIGPVAGQTVVVAGVDEEILF